MSKVLKYKGYIGTVDVDIESNCLSGEILYINDLIMYEGDTPSELEESFHQAIDGYLAMCEKHGKVPNKPFKGSFNVRITPELHRAAVISATANSLNLNEYVKTAIQERVDRDNGNALIVHQTHIHNHPVSFITDEVTQPLTKRINQWESSPATALH